MENPQVLGTIQYIGWLILTDRVQPSFIAVVVRWDVAAATALSDIYPHFAKM